MILDRGGEGDQCEQVKEPAGQEGGVQAVRRRGSEDSDWVPPKAGIKVPSSETSTSQRQLRSSAKTQALLESLPSGEAAESPTDSGTRADSSGPDRVIVDTSENVAKEKKQKKKRKEVWYTRDQIKCL